MTFLKVCTMCTDLLSYLCMCYCSPFIKKTRKYIDVYNIDADPDPHNFGKPDPDLHPSENQDPDLHQRRIQIRLKVKI
jgi:hypothetical protein